MRRFVTAIAAGTIAIFVLGMIVVSARSVRAQETDQSGAQYEGAFGASGAVAQPEKAVKAPPIDVNGCWTGTMLDVDAGSGNGYLNFDQPTAKNGQPTKALKGIKSTATHNIYVVWSDNSCAYGFGPGTATSTGFHEKLNTGGKCKVTVIGNTSGNNLVGSYTFHGCSSSFGEHSGSFNLTFDVTGDACNIPNACDQ
jgi:hypothetical protein